MSQIIVVGSINIDVVSYIDRHPKPGETIMSRSSDYHFGGKGANQAVSAARTLSDVHMIGAVGKNDLYGERLIANLQAYGINTDFLQRKEGLSGSAFIQVDGNGENCIILSDGTNGLLTPDDIDVASSSFQQAEALLLQNEIPCTTNLHALRKAKDEGLQVYYNPAPAMQLPGEAFPLIDFLVLNETEAEMMTGCPLENLRDAGHICRQLIDYGSKHVVLTMGKQGSLYMNTSYEDLYVPAFEVQTVDTTAAGDAFIGAFASSMCQGKFVQESLIYASASAAMTVTRKGAQQAIPDHHEIVTFIQKKAALNMNRQ